MATIGLMLGAIAMCGVALGTAFLVAYGFGADVNGTTAALCVASGSAVLFLLLCGVAIRDIEDADKPAP